MEGATPTQPVQLIHDLLLERVAGPAVLRCRGSGPVALCLIPDLVEQDDNLASGQSAYSPLASSLQAAAICRRYLDLVS